MTPSGRACLHIAVGCVLALLSVGGFLWSHSVGNYPMAVLNVMIFLVNIYLIGWNIHILGRLK